MKYTWIIPVLLIAAILLTAGCTLIGGGKPTPAPTTVPPTPIVTAPPVTTVPTTPGGSTVPGPTQTIPVAQSVSVTAEKAGTYSTTIITSFDGGKGINFVSKIDVRVTRPDGSVVTGVLQPSMGDTLELEGTSGTDRVEVIVTMKSGDVYKIIDQQLPYKTRG